MNSCKKLSHSIYEFKYHMVLCQRTCIVFFKTIEASNSLGWTIRSKDYTTGTIVGETIYGGGGKPRFITIELTESPDKVRVDVSLSSVNPDLKFYFSRQINRFYSELDKLIQAGELD